MAEVFRAVNGRKLSKALAASDDVQDYMDDLIFEMGVRAEEDLLRHYDQGHSFIEVEEGNVDRYLILNDERGQKAAMSIEYGRQAGEYVDDEGRTHEISAMEGLFILHKAARIRKKKDRGKVALGKDDL